MKKRVILFCFICMLSVCNLWAFVVKGTIIDASTKEPLIGVSIFIESLNKGAITDFNGNYELSLPEGKYSMRISYVGYREILEEDVFLNKDLVVDFEMSVDAQVLNDVVVTAQKNMENEKMLQLERKISSLAIENIGAKEMSMKGIGNVAEGVKKLTGISIASSGQLVVRGLGDRYSMTTLNGLPIASPNPDNKLIPLDIFPLSTIKNITVKKVYNPSQYADYSGAHIDITTKNIVNENYFNIGVNVGLNTSTIGTYRLGMDNSSLFLKSSVDKQALNLSLSDYDNYVKNNPIFTTSFGVKSYNWMPNLGLNLGLGHKFKLGDHILSLVLSGTIDNDYQNTKDATYKTLEATGNIQNDFIINSYEHNLNIAALGCLGLTLRKSDHVGYTFFYARNASNEFQERKGIDAEGHNLVGINDITHIYSLLVNQLEGVHYLGDSESWKLTWAGSYCLTTSDEPDRRQVMFEKKADRVLSLFKLNRQETMRYFGDLNESEWNASINASWDWGEKNKLIFGFNMKNKGRLYTAIRFYYNLNKLNPEIDDIYHADNYLNFDNIRNGNIVVERKMQPKDTYKAGFNIYALHLQHDYYISPSFLLNVGIRAEMSQQSVDYATDGGYKYAKRRELNKFDLFPVLNLKYELKNNHVFRFSVSRTITRPSFIEMAPFLYQESYGASQIRGNEILNNAYNYNFDLRYEFITDYGDMISLTGYAKYLENPIERIQTLQGGATLHSFRNAEQGFATGAEFEAKKQIIKDFSVGLNASYMYTNVKLSDNGAYTNKERSLQGASPILLNVDLTYSPKINDNHQLGFALLYNFQGERIYAVGVSGLGDITELPTNTLNFNLTYNLYKNFTIALKIKDLLAQDAIFKQKVIVTNENVEVERFNRSTSFDLSFSYKL